MIAENCINNIEVSFVIPCLNEEKTLKMAIDFCLEAIVTLGTKCEIIVADNGSNDRSIEIAQSLGARVVSVIEKGYGSALIGGIKQSFGKYIVMGDADATYDFREAVEFIKLLRNNDADLVMGSRLKGNIEKGAMPFLHRYLGTPVLSFLIRGFFQLKISDCNCGMRAFTRDAFNKMDLISSGMEFASEMLIKSGILNLTVKEVKCSLYKDQRDRAPHLKTWRDGWRHLKFVLAFAPKYVFYYPSFISMGLGLFLTLFIAFGRVNIDNVSFDYNFMYIGTLLFIIGYQLKWLHKFDSYYLDFIGYLKNKKTDHFNFDSYAQFSGITIFIGVVLALFSVFSWLKNNFYANGITIRLLIFAIDFILFSIITFINALMVSMMQIKVKR